MVERYRGDRPDRGFLPDPGMNVVGGEHRMQTVEIAEA
jgi:hypothetical protein